MENETENPTLHETMDAKFGDHWKTDESPWSTTQEGQIRRAIEKVFPRQDAYGPGHENGPEPEAYRVTDTGYVAMIETKSPRAKALLLPFVRGPEENMPALPPVRPSEATTPCTGYSVDFFGPLAAVFNAARPKRPGYGTYNAGEMVALTFGSDYPLLMETDDFRVMLAPRIISED